jgi:hypothetical protein
MNGDVLAQRESKGQICWEVEVQHESTLRYSIQLDSVHLISGLRSSWQRGTMHAMQQAGYRKTNE